MALQDGLLSFAIKETIFLSSDRAGIGELQELELIPDVEVLENQSYISITGCLQLYGKYEPIRDTAESDRDGTETLVEAMTFSPFRQEGSEGPFYGWEEQIGHRIPLNITIPLERIAEIGDIYAVVDSFDYSLETPHQLLIEAELKIAGIVFADQAQEHQQQPQEQVYTGYQETEPARQEEAWEFAHVAADQSEAEPASLDEIEQKLFELEREMERQAQPVSYESAESAALYDAPALQVSSHPTHSHQYYGEVTEEEEPPTEAVSFQEEGNAEAEESWETDTATYETQSASYESPQDQGDQEEQEEHWGEVSGTRTAEEEELTLTIHEEQELDYTPIAAEELQVSEEPQIDDDVEVRVAISGKASREEAGNLNITSIFSQASRAKQEAQALESESSSSSFRKGGSAGTPATREAMQNLTSFVRSREERSSQLKMCIIQRDETLESISQRYSLPASRIVEVNRLTTEQLVAGQILYIPQ